MKIAVAEKLAQILDGSNDYLSFETAIFLHGLAPEPPRIIRIVTNGRRRAREICDHRLEFVYHKADRPARTSIVQYSGSSLRTATLCQALVDVLADMHLQLPGQAAANWFWSLPFDVFELVKLAEGTSVAAHKRALFWSLWSGRAGVQQIVPATISRTPVYIFPDEKTEQQWEGLLQVFYPAWLHDFAAAECEKSFFVKASDSDWLEIRKYRPLIDFMKAEKWLAFNGDQRQQAKKKLQSFLNDELERQLRTGPGPCLRRFFNVSHGDGEKAIPEYFMLWLRQNADFPASRAAILKNWCMGVLESGNDSDLNAAFHLAPLIGLTRAAVEILAGITAKVFALGFSNCIIDLCSKAEKERIPLPFQVRILLARIHARNSCFAASENELQAARKIADLSEKELLDLEFASGVILRQAGKIDEAIDRFRQALNKALATEQAARVAAIESAIGNAYFVTGNLEAARIAYLNAFRLCRGSTVSQQTANLRTNLGLVEFKSGNLAKADRFFQQSAEDQKIIGNLQGQCISLLTLAKTRLATGKISAARNLLIRVEKMSRDFQAADLECRAIMALCDDLLGRPVNYNPVPVDDFSQKNHLSAASIYLIRYFNALRLLFRCRFSDAAHELELLEEFGLQHQIPADEIAFVIFYRALALYMRNSSAACQVLKKSLQMLSQKPEHPFNLLCLIFAAGAFPVQFRDIDVEAGCRKIVQTGYFEPLWPLMASAIKNLPGRQPQKLLEEMSAKSPAALLKNFVSLVPAFKKFLVKPVAKKAAQRFLLLSNYGEETISYEMYQSWHNAKPSLVLRFDTCSGRLSYGHNSTILKPANAGFRILIQLLSCYPGKVSIADLFEQVWGSRFDNETDRPAVKTSLSRLRSVLRKVCSSIRIVKSRTDDSVQLTTNSHFEMITPIDAT